MTSQTVVSNADGVALASDSAVTMGRTQTFESANKIYPLGEDHKVAVMISDSARYAPGGVSWSKFFHEFANSLVSPCATMQEYAEKMIRWANDGNMFDERQNDIAIQNSLSNWFDWEFAHEKWSLEIGEMATQIFMEPAEEAVNEAYAEADIETEEDADEFEEWAETYTQSVGDLSRLGRSTLVDAITKIHNELEAQRRKLSGDYEVEGPENKKKMPVDREWIKQEDAIFEKSRANCEEVAERIAAHYGLNDVQKEMLTVVFQNFLTRFPIVGKWSLFPPNSTGHRLRGFGVAKIVLAGYGTDDETPVIVECMCGPWIDPRQGMFVQECVLKIRPQQHVFDNGWAEDHFSDGEHQIDASAIVRGYAFNHEMDTILTGIHPFVMSDLRSRETHKHGTGKVAKQITEKITAVIFAALEDTKGIGKKRVTEITSEVNSRLKKESTVEKFLDDSILERLQFRRHRFREVLKLLPIPDLADFARELVNIEKGICYWLDSVRSVGGEVSVVTITKEEGVKIIE